MSEPQQSAPAAGGKRALKVGVQLLGFGFGIAMLFWCAREAFKPENRDQLARLGEASAGSVALLLGCSLATLVLNGLIFWVVLRPERRLSILDTIATNMFATMLAYLPFKISVLARVALHNRRDGVPLMTIAAWFGAIGATVLVALGPVTLASLWRQGIDPVWWVAAGGGVVGLLAAMIVTARLFAHERGLARLHRMTDPLKIGPLNRFLRTDAFMKLHGVFGMLAHARASIGSTGLRLLDVVAVQGLRFMVAASILGVDLEWEHAILFAGSFFLIGMLSPFGMLGTREAGSLGIASALGFAEAGESLAVVVLLVSATESIVALVAGVLGGVRVRPDRLVRGAKAAASL